MGLWWTDKTRRIDARHPASRKRKDQSQSQDDDELEWSLSDWENWLESESDSDNEAENDSDLSVTSVMSHLHIVHNTKFSAYSYVSHSLSLILTTHSHSIMSCLTMHLRTH